MEYLHIDTEYLNPEMRSVEIVERKGLGHPDTLADALAEEISCTYSQYCLDHFGAVLHHNMDKVYIGGGWFQPNFGCAEMKHPVQIVTNGRMSSCLGDLKIDIENIQSDAVKKHLSRVLPHLDVDTELSISVNTTQHTKRPNWFTPCSLNDVPDADKAMANDTSVCVAHYPLTSCEQLAISLERYFWKESGEGSLIPRATDIGQDIKVMVERRDNEINATLCVPLISTFTPSWRYYQERNNQIERDLNALAQKIVADKSYNVTVGVNPSRGQVPLLYMLCIGSCIECGEEGLVGRGNNNQGIIPVFRPHSMEAFPGKNPRYHTGRVLGYLTKHLAKAIFDRLGVGCTVVTLTKNTHSLVPPSLLSINLEREVDRETIVRIVEEDFIEVNYLDKLLSERVVC